MLTMLNRRKINSNQQNDNNNLNIIKNISLKAMFEELRDPLQVQIYFSVPVCLFSNKNNIENMSIQVTKALIKQPPETFDFHTDRFLFKTVSFSHFVCHYEMENKSPVSPQCIMGYDGPRTIHQTLPSNRDKRRTHLSATSEES